MVTILPPKPSLGSALGQGLSQGLEQGFHRNQLQSALSRAESQLSNPNVSPTQQLFGLMKGLAGYPGAERFIGPIFEQLQRNRSLSAAANVPPPSINSPVAAGGISTPLSTALGGSSEPIQQGVPPSALSSALQQLGQFNITPPRGSGSVSPTEIGKGVIAPTFSPESRLAERQKAAQQGIDPAVVDSAMDAWDKAAIQQADIQTNAAKTHADIARLRAERQNEFLEKSQRWLNAPDMHPDDFQMFAQISEQPQFENLGSDIARFRATKKMFDIAQLQKHALLNLGKRPLFFSKPAEDHKKAVEIAVKPLINLGQQDLVQKLIQQELGYGPATAAKLINDLPPQVYSQLNKLPEYVVAEMEISPWEKSPTVTTYNKSESQKIWSDFLKTAIKPGKYDVSNPNQRKPGTSLYALQDETQKKGMPPPDFFGLVQQLHKNGDIDLDDYQRIELTNLEQPEYKRYGLPELLYRMLPGYKEKK